MAGKRIKLIDGNCFDFAQERHLFVQLIGPDKEVDEERLGETLAGMIQAMSGFGPR